jgi:NADH:ubiquinone oxidoreductase subunit 4 (subunit M)
MEIQLTLLILFPLMGFILESILPRFYKKTEGFSAILFSVATVMLAILFCNNFDPIAKEAQFVYERPWIAGWNINFKLALDGMGCIGIMLASVVFLVTTVISKSDKKDNFYFAMIMLLEAFVIGFLISYDYILKILFWEASWIPIFFLLIVSVKKRFALLYSRYWFFSEFLIIVASIMLFSSGTLSYDLERITHLQLGGGAVVSVIFFLLMGGTMIRVAMFPFDACLNRAIQNCEHNISLITTTVMTTIPFFFMASVVLPLFKKEFNTYIDVIAVAALISILVCVIRLFIDKKISTIISTQILIFNAMTFIWFINPTQNLMNASMEIIVTKALLNILIIYFGRVIIAKGRNRSNFELWMFAIPVVLSFGLPGIMMIRPLFTLISSWYGIAPYVSITVVFLLMAAFLYTFINMSELFRPFGKKTEPVGFATINNILLLVIMLVSLTVSIVPYYVHDLSASYYRTYIGWDR